MRSKAELEAEVERLRARVTELENEAGASARPILPLLGRDIPPLGLLDGLPTPVDVRNARGEVVYVNPAYSRIFGVRREAVLGKSIDDILPADFAEAYEVGDEEVLQCGTRFTREHVFVSDKGPVSLVIEKFPVRDVGGETVGVGSIVLDVERLGASGRALEKAVLLNHDRFENSPIPMTDEDWSEAKRMLDQLRANGVTDFREHILEHPEILRELGPALRHTAG